MELCAPSFWEDNQSTVKVSKRNLLTKKKNNDSSHINQLTKMFVNCGISEPLKAIEDFSMRVICKALHLKYTTSAHNMG